MITRVSSVFAAVLLALCSTSQAGLLSVTRSNTNDIVIPTFDPSMGTLTNVSLTVKLLAGGTNITGTHHHSPIAILSTNTATSSYSGGFSTILSSSHTHSVGTPSYSGGGINIGNFNFSTTTSTQSHTVNIGINSILVGIFPNAYRGQALIEVQDGGNHTMNYGQQVKNFGYSGAGVTPFIGTSDIVIGAPAISTTTNGNHSLFLPAFNNGPFSFSSNVLSSSGNHAHTLDPRFTTTVVFEYDEPVVEPVPEPTSLALLGMGVAGLGGYRIRRKRQQAA